MMKPRDEAKQLIPLLTTDECRGLLADSLPLLDKDAGKSYRAVYQALADVGRADVFREELRAYLYKKSFILLAKKLIADGSAKSKQMLDAYLAEGAKEGASEADKVCAEIIRDELRPALHDDPANDDDALAAISEALTPSNAGLRALDTQTALKLINKEGSQSNPEKQLAKEAKETIFAQNQFALVFCNARLFPVTTKFTSKRLTRDLLHYVERGKSAKVIAMITSHPELLEEWCTVESYPDRRFYPIQLAAVEKNGLLCKAMKEVAIEKLPDGLATLQAQLSDPFFQLRLQPETDYDFTPLMTAISTDTNVDAAIAQYLSDLKEIIEERGFPLGHFLQIINIYRTTNWTWPQYDTLFIKAFGGAQNVSPPWLKLLFARGIVEWDGQHNREKPFVLQYRDDLSIDPLLGQSSGLGDSIFVDLSGAAWLTRVGRLRWLTSVGGGASLKTLLEQTRANLADLCSNSAQLRKR